MVEIRNKIKKYQKPLKYYLLLLISVTFISLFIFVPFLLENKAFVIGYDIRSQYRPWMKEFHRLISSSIHTFRLPFWDWNIFLGNNVYASKINYFLGDVYSYISLIVNKDIYKELMDLTQLKIIVSATTFYLYALYRKWDLKISILSSLLFAFSTWFLKSIEHPFYISFYSFVPLYFLVIEITLKDKKYYLLSLITAYLLMMNYYFSVPLLLLTPLYYLYRFYEINHSFSNISNILKKFIVFWFIGFVLSAIVTLPAFLYIIQNDRVFSNSTNLLYFSDIKVYLSLIAAWILPSSTYISQIVLVDGVQSYTSVLETGTHHTRNLMLFSGSIVPIIIWIDYLQNKYIRKQYQFYFIIMFLILFIPVGSAFLHGFSETNFRWTYIFIFMNIMLFSEAIIRIRFKEISILKTIAPTVLIILFLYLSIVLFVDSNIISYTNNNLVTIITIIFTILFILILKYSKYVFSLILIVSIFELSWISYYSLNNNPNYKQFDETYIYRNESVLGDHYGELKTYLDHFDNDFSFYRIYIPHDSLYWYMSVNQNLVYGFADIKTYDSTYSPTLREVKDYIDLDLGLGWTWVITNPDLLNLYSAKYALGFSDETVPFNRFERVVNYKGIEVYKNLDYQALVSSYSTVISKTAYLNEFDVSKIDEYLIVNDNDINSFDKDYSNAEISNLSIAQNELNFNVTSSDISTALIKIPYDSGWKASINNIDIKTYNTNAGLLAFELPQGEYEVNMKFTPSGFKIGVIITFMSLLLLIYLSKRSTYNKLFK